MSSLMVRMAHFSAEPMVFEHRVYEQIEHGIYGTRVSIANTALGFFKFKPRGLWLSAMVDGEWDWERALKGMPELDKSTEHCTIFDVNMSRLLVLSDKKDMRSFEKEYGNGFVKGESSMDKILNPRMENLFKRYDGIAIPVHHPKWVDKSMNRWYGGWDCGCAVVWNTVSSVEVVR